ncbi:ABC transporter substrate-binding protein [Galactobacillus timonensis]|uniref:ABC transporter substrate-binding protein n=1 Tax=Galactobacillus timonensis TaxID=2041840 RepID=UPI000C8257E5|nr:ABC transporter substrate-binding protein [Galactobacillus timonensis]
MKNVFKGGMAVAMCMALAACGSGSSTTPASTAGSDNAAASTTSEVKKFKLGGSGPISGNAAVYGTAVMNAAQIAVDEINAKGGPVQFDFKFEDDQADSEAAVNAYNTLADWGMQVSLATTTSGAGQAVSPLYKEDQTFAITPSGSSTAVIFDDSGTAYGNVFQMCFTDPNQGVASADYLSEHPDLGSKVAVIYRNDDNYSTGIYNTFVDQAAKDGLDVVYTGTFTKDAPDFSVQVQQAQAAGADIVFLPIYYQPASLILQAAKTAGYTPTFFGCDGMDGILTQENFDTSLAEGLYMLTPFSADSTDEKTQAFVKAYEDKFGDVPNQFAADAYDAVYAIAQALEASGVTADDDNATICDALVKQFTTMKFQGITGTGDITWNENGEVSKGPRAIVIQNGTYVSAE